MKHALKLVSLAAVSLFACTIGMRHAEAQASRTGTSQTQLPVPESGTFGDVTATSTNERFRRVRVSVTAAPQLVGQVVEVRQDGHVLGSAVFYKQSDRSVALVTLPMPPRGQGSRDSSVWIGGKRAISLVLPDIENERRALAESAPVLFTSFVFAGEEFPQADFEQPSLMEDALGVYTIKTQFYDASYNLVTRATTPGRYGAVVEVQLQSGLSFKRYITLYRQDRVLDWNSNKSDFTGELPPEIGVSAEALRQRGALWSKYLKQQFVDGLARDSSSGALLAGLHEAGSGNGSGSWNNPWHRDETWWYGLKKKLGQTQKTRYLVDLPTDYAKGKAKKWPLVLFLHGSGESGDDLNVLRRHGLPKLVAQGQRFPFILVSPQAPQDYLLATQLIEVLDEVQTKYRVDTDRVYVTGLSMGGNGTWFLALEFPERFAAIAPIAASGDPGGAARLKNLPTWYFVGAKDDTFDPQRADDMVAAMKEAGVPFKFTRYPNAGHSETWEKAYADPELYKWLLSQRRAQ